MLEIDHSDEQDIRLPPTLPPITARSGNSVLTSQPNSSRNQGLQWRSQSKIGPSAVDLKETPRRSMKQVARGHREWSSGLCDCRDDTKLCLWTCCCPHLTMSTIADHAEDHCCTAWFPGTCVPMRTKIRSIGGIKGTVMGDCCVMCCCMCCGICQMAREVDHMVIQPEQYVKPVQQ